MMEVELNHERAVLPTASTLYTALTTWGYDPAAVAVAVNETFVPRDQWPAQTLHHGDRLNVLGRIVGG